MNYQRGKTICPLIALIFVFVYVECVGLQKRYQIFRDLLTFDKAVEKCNDLDARLAMPKDKLEMDELLATFRKVNAVAMSHQIVMMLGFNRSGGDSIDNYYNDWQPGEPNNLNETENCVVVDTIQKSLINDDKCTNQYYYACEYPSDKYSSGLDFVYEPTVGKSYAFSSKMMDWHKAVAFCHKHNSNLAKISNDAELDHFKKWKNRRTGKFVYTSGTIGQVLVSPAFCCSKTIKTIQVSVPLKFVCERRKEFAFVIEDTKDYVLVYLNKKSEAYDNLEKVLIH